MSPPVPENQSLVLAKRFPPHQRRTPHTDPFDKAWTPLNVLAHAEDRIDALLMSEADATPDQLVAFLKECVAVIDDHDTVSRRFNVWSVAIYMLKHTPLHDNNIIIRVMDALVRAGFGRWSDVANGGVVNPSFVDSVPCIVFDAVANADQHHILLLLAKDAVRDRTTCAVLMHILHMLHTHCDTWLQCTSRILRSVLWLFVKDVTAVLLSHKMEDTMLDIDAASPDDIRRWKQCVQYLAHMVHHYPTYVAHDTAVTVALALPWNRAIHTPEPWRINALSKAAHITYWCIASDIKTNPMIMASRVAPVDPATWVGDMLARMLTSIMQANIAPPTPTPHLLKDVWNVVTKVRKLGGKHSDLSALKRAVEAHHAGPGCMWVVKHVLENENTDWSLFIAACSDLNTDPHAEVTQMLRDAARTHRLAPQIMCALSRGSTRIPPEVLQKIFSMMHVPAQTARAAAACCKRSR